MCGQHQLEPGCKRKLAFLATRSILLPQLLLLLLLLSPFDHRVVSNTLEGTTFTSQPHTYVPPKKAILSSMFCQSCSCNRSSISQRPVSHRCYFFVFFTTMVQVIGKKRAALTQLEEECHLSITEEVVRQAYASRTPTCCPAPP